MLTPRVGTNRHGNSESPRYRLSKCVWLYTSDVKYERRKRMRIHRLHRKPFTMVTSQKNEWKSIRYFFYIENISLKIAFVHVFSQLFKLSMNRNFSKTMDVMHNKKSLQQ